MKTCILYCVGCFVFSLAMAGSIAVAADADPAVQKTCDKMLAALIAKDRTAFAAEGTDAVKEGTTEQVMEQTYNLVGIRLKAGYTASYLCTLKQAGLQIHLWKLTFKDGEDDLIVRIAFKDGKVGGFFFQ